MKLLDSIRTKAARLNKHIVLPEGKEERMIAAAEILIREEICQVTLLGETDALHNKATEKQVSLKNVQIIDPQQSDKLDYYASTLYELRKHKGLQLDEARAMVEQPLFFGDMMVRMDDASGSVAGAMSTTGDVIKAGIYCIGLKKDISVVSSTFLMIIPGWDRPFTYADAGVVPDPDPEQLADIAIASANTHYFLTGDTPVVAMLSFSTYGSASHPLVEKVQESIVLAKQKAPELEIDGELQADAAIIPEIGSQKAPKSSVAGKANVLIFPDLNAGNIAYKLTQRFARADAIGPLIQGLNKPAMDLSRGCSVNDIINVSAICCLLAK